MSKKLSVRLNESQQEELTFLYKLYQIKNETDADRFRNLLHAIYSEKNEQLESEETLEALPSCPMIPTLITLGKHKGMVFCPNPKVVGLRKGNHVSLGVCLNCWIRQENAREHEGIPTSETTLAPEYDVKEPEPKKSKPQSVQKQRKCIDCGCDISNLEDWKTLCLSCWQRKQNPAWQGEGKPLAGSPMALRMKEAEAIRRANAKLNTKSKEE